MSDTTLNARVRGLGIGLLTTLIVILSACGMGAGGGGGGFGGIADGGIRGTGKSLGPISGFGSVIVNGTRFNTDDAEFIVNGEPAIQDDLAEGMVVIVDISEESDRDNPRASRIRYDDDVRGPLAAPFDPLGDRMTVLGQTILFNSATVFRGLPLETLAVTGGAYVRVSGWYLDSGAFQASFVRSRAAFDRVADEVEVRGRIASVDNGADTFMIGNLTVVVTENTEIEMADDRDRLRPADVGAMVEAEGLLDASGRMIAEEVEQESAHERLGDINGSDIELEGTLTDGLSGGPSGTFRINGITVRVNPDTEFEGLKSGDLRTGTRVFVEGVGNTSAQVVAKRIKSREVEVEVRARIRDIAVSSNPREGFLDVGGVRVEVTARTMVVAEDEDDEGGNLQFGDLLFDDFVEVSGIPREDAEGDYIEAVKVERAEDEDESGGPRLKGRVEDTPAADSFSILGITLRVDGSTGYEDGLTGYGSITEGMLLEVRYVIDPSGTTFLAREIKLKEEDPGNDNGSGGGDDDEED